MAQRGVIFRVYPFVLLSPFLNVIPIDFCCVCALIFVVFSPCLRGDCRVKLDFEENASAQSKREQTQLTPAQGDAN